MIEQYKRDHNWKYKNTSSIDVEKSCIDVNNNNSNDMTPPNNHNQNIDDCDIEIGIENIKRGDNITDIDIILFELSQAVIRISQRNERKNGALLSSLSNSDREADPATKGVAKFFLFKQFLNSIVVSLHANIFLIS